MTACGRLPSCTPGCLQMLVANDDSINRVTDLEGRKFGIGGAGSGDNAHAIRVFEACGMSIDDDIDAQYIGVNESSDQLKDGQIDGFINMASIPYSVVTELTMSGKGKLIGLTEEQVEALTAGEDAVYSPYTIPPGPMTARRRRSSRSLCRRSSVWMRNGSPRRPPIRLPRPFMKIRRLCANCMPGLISTRRLPWIP